MSGFLAETYRKNRLYFLIASPLAGAVIGFLAATVKPGARFSWFKVPPWLAPDASLPAFGPYLVASMLCWAAFGIYWETVAKNAAEAKSSESSSSRLVHVLIVNIAVLIEFIPIPVFGRFASVIPPLMMLGVAVQLMGLLLALWSRVHLGRNWSGAIAVKVEHQLIRSGPYRLLRHPIYTGLMMMYVGLPLVTGEWHAWIGVAMAAFAYWRKIRLEEAVLVEAFGVEYDNYRRGTWTLLPGIY